GVLRVRRARRGLRRPIAGTVARPAGGLPDRGPRAGPALLRTHLGGDAHGARVRGHILDDHGIGPDRGVVADDDWPEDLRPGADEHMIADGRVPLGLLHRGAAVGDLVVAHDVIADLRGVPDGGAQGVHGAEARY